MYYNTTPFNNPPEFCDEDGKPLQESVYYEDVGYDIYTGQKVSPGTQIKLRFCPVFYPRHKYSAWSIKEGDKNWLRRLAL
jgi:hypothetical protein